MTGLLISIPLMVLVLVVAIVPGLWATFSREEPAKTEVTTATVNEGDHTPMAA